MAHRKIRCPYIPSAHAILGRVACGPNVKSRNTHSRRREYKGSLCFRPTAILLDDTESYRAALFQKLAAPDGQQEHWPCKVRLCCRRSVQASLQVSCIGHCMRLDEARLNSTDRTPGAASNICYCSRYHCAPHGAGPSPTFWAAYTCKNPPLALSLLIRNPKSTLTVHAQCSN